MSEKVYITAPIYYANGSPHIGHFLTTTIADVLARYYKLKVGEKNVFFTTGLDEHGTTVEQSAIKEGHTPETFQDYVDKRAIEWKKAFDETNIEFDYFVRTTDLKHKKFAQDFIAKLVEAGDVYKGKYTGKYCNGCEKFLTLSDLNEENCCPNHRPDQVIEVEEENYFFKLSKYAPIVAEKIKDGDIKISPENKKLEMLRRIESGVEDVSISRPKTKVSWGIKFPEDSEQTIYVWVEALLNYLSNLEINNNQSFWEGRVIHTLAKDINWFHNVIWPAMLLSTKHPLYKESFVHSYLTLNGKKISKSFGNIITPKELVEKYGIDGARYLILTNFPSKNDTDITWNSLDEKYNADLANGLGNTVARLAKLAESSGLGFPVTGSEDSLEINDFRVDLALQVLWNRLRELDKHINENEPWVVDDKEILRKILNHEIAELRNIAQLLGPFIPDTANKIQDQFGEEKIKSEEGLFPRI
ncbi:methionine--tRNA ligase [Patescibacteria group bacterium]